MGGIYEDAVCPGFHKGGGSVNRRISNTDSRCSPESSPAVLAGLGEIHCLLGIFQGNEAGQVSFSVHQGQLLQSVFSQKNKGILKTGSNRSGNQLIQRSHQFYDRNGTVCFKMVVSVGKYSGQNSLFHHRKT